MCVCNSVFVCSFDWLVELVRNVGAFELSLRLGCFFLFVLFRCHGVALCKRTQYTITASKWSFSDPKLKHEEQ